MCYISTCNVVGIGRPPAVNMPVAPVPESSTSAFLQQQQHELQSKILNILNGSSSSGVPQGPPQPVQAQVSAGYRGVAPTGVGRAPSGPSPLINFDNPNVKKALDNLIQNPSLLKSLPSSVSPSAQFSVATAGAPRQQPLGYPSQGQAQSQAAPGGGFGGGQFQQQAQSQGLQRAQAPGGYGAPRPSMAPRPLLQQGRPRY